MVLTTCMGCSFARKFVQLDQIHESSESWQAKRGIAIVAPDTTLGSSSTEEKRKAKSEAVGTAILSQFSQLLLPRPFQKLSMPLLEHDGNSLHMGFPPTGGRS
eukprot:2479763-Rhodomonas_salina.2